MKHLEEIFHRILIFLTPVIVFIAYEAGIAIEFIEIALAILIIIASLFLLFRNTYLNPDKEINHFKTFWYDKFFGVELGEKLTVSATIFVVQGQTKKDKLSKKLDSLFKGEFNKDEFATPRFEWKHSDPALLKTELRGALENKKAILVVRSRELDQHPWVYDLVDDWAHENPEAPCLYIDEDIIEATSEELVRNGHENVPDKYYSIDYKPKLVPWALLQRSNKRGLAWRKQSSFNLLMWKHTVIFVPILLSLLLILYLDKRTEASNFEARARNLETRQKKIFQLQQDQIALETEREFKAKRKLTIKTTEPAGSNDGDVKLFVSYLLPDKDDPNILRQVGVSDPDSNRTSWSRDESNNAGCSFVHKDNFVEWTFNDEFAKVVSIRGIENKNIKCPFLNRSQDKIKSIACFAENKSDDPKLTVGICIKTEANTLISQYDYRTLLSERALEFYKHNLEIISAASGALK